MNILLKNNSQAYITKNYHENKPLHLGTFVIKRNFSHVHVSEKLKLLRIGLYKIFDRLPDVTNELLSQDGSTLHVHKNHLIPYYPKEPLLYPHVGIFMRFSDSTNYNIPKPIKYAKSDSSPFNSDEFYRTTTHHKILLPYLHYLITILIFPQNTIHSQK